MLFSESHLNPEDKPLESGRLTPQRLSKGIILNIVMQMLIGVGIFAAADQMIRPEYHNLTLLIIQYSITLLLIIFSIPYLFPRYYFKKQYAQVCCFISARSYD